MAFYSKYPILEDEVRRFQTFLWIDLPGNIKPGFVSDQQRLFDKDFWDIPIDVNGRIVHVLMCHAVVPVFEPENDERNFDTLRFIAEYIQGQATYATADGGMASHDVFALIGDLNADPDDGDSLPGAVQQVLNLARVTDNQPEGDGEDTDGMPPDNTTYNTSTNNFRRNTFKSGIANTTPGGTQLQLDFLLPSNNLPLGASAVFWSQLDDPDWTLQRRASDHHFMWTDVVVPGPLGDIDDDGDVDLVDRDLFIGVLLGTNQDAGQIGRSDLDNDGQATGGDVGLMVSALLGTP